MPADIYAVGAAAAATAAAVADAPTAPLPARVAVNKVVRQHTGK